MVGLTYLQCLVLLVLWEQDDRSVGEIGRCLHLNSGTLTPVIRRLEKLAFLTRTRRPPDEREVHVRLTQSGSRLETELASVRVEMAGRTGLTAVAFKRLREELHDLNVRLRQPRPLDDSASATVNKV